MKVLHRKCGAVTLQSVIQRIRNFPAYKWEVTEQQLDAHQGRVLCRTYYSCICRHGTSAMKPTSQDVAVLRKNQGYVSKMLASSPLHSYKNGSLTFDRRFNLKNSGVITLSKGHIRWLNTASCNRHFNCDFFSSCLLSSTTNCSVWNHIERKGLKSGRDKVGQSHDEILNPIDRLQQFIAVPLLPEKDFIFKPSINEVAKAQNLFLPQKNHQIEFLKSALFEEHLPDYPLPEVAFIGRSNVGKSSLIQILLSHTDVIVRTSRTPGHTKLLNFFKLGEKFTLIDMPGYGYNMPEHYASSVETFLSSRKKLTRTFILVDSTVGVTENDVIGLDMLEEFRIPYVMTFLLIDGYGPNTVDAARFEMINAMKINYCIVMTKIDKTKPAHLLKSFMTVLKYRDEARHCFQQPFLVSSINGEGVALLQTFIAYVTGCVKIQGL